MGTCDPTSGQEQLLKKLLALQKPKGVAAPPSNPMESSLSNDKLGATGDIVICPDPTRACPDGNTCCLMPNHQWVCCPLPFAVCCADGFHCCPSGSRCDPSSTRCTREDSASTLLSFLAIGNQRVKEKL
jgi:hypothetical protein